MVVATLRSAGAHALERGALRGPWAGGLAAWWGQAAARRLARPLRWPAEVRSVVVGGSTLGGSGRTAVALACAVTLAEAGVRSVLVGHAYRARPGRARVVNPDDPVAEVGDEALLAARTLGERAKVVVAPTRQAAVNLAARQARVLVLDGLAQTSPIRASMALLAVDSLEPWGHTSAMPPRGDLRAPIGALLDACDGVVLVGRTASSVWISEEPAFARESLGTPRSSAGPFAWSAGVRSRGAWVHEPGRGEGRRSRWLSWGDLGRARVGLLTALARPDRVLRGLAARSVFPAVVRRAPDHGPITGALLRACRADARRNAVDLWLVTPKCALHLEPHVASSVTLAGAAGGLLGAPVATLEHSLVLAADLCARLVALGAP